MPSLNPNGVRERERVRDWDGSEGLVLDVFGHGAYATVKFDDGSKLWKATDGLTPISQLGARPAVEGN
ncbi:Uncharacterised protein (plasmid) [Tsukamurella tyrosinosolvens]|uniref:Uncharacterized protein n=1 Tax=Tsukamurella tyrosinosolvens TaxID=57704 RepID=A0A1H4VKA0_TSUTY|nr:hypothetical protein [Tsukamurella tyrosinosolvens]SEC81250.1 hypothetical protein SAMN04489793_3251 [Tsukamurella tyrosinosolvens]VEH90473.1 Uncharacterised protein [Tsukamurella tyrosinosolvens]